MAEYIREVEGVIDNYHKQSPMFSLNRKTALFNALTVFEDICRLGGTQSIALMGDSLEYSFFIREHLDSLNILIQWIFQDCSYKDNDTLDVKIVPETYKAVAASLLFHAKPYSPICSAYISYSRGQFTANINESQKKITFVDNPDNRNIVISDMMETILGDQASGLRFAPTQGLQLANDELIRSIQFHDGHISYRTDDEIWLPFQNMMERQWLCTSELPEEWEFDAFSIKDFKQIWITIATLSFIHMLACLKSGIQGADVEEAILIKSPAQFSQIIIDKAKIPSDRVVAVLKLLTYNHRLKNNDIVYQPFVQLDSDQLALAPHLILASRPERNLISLVHKIRDKSYFELTNLREGLMQDELDSVTIYKQIMNSDE